MGHIVTFDSSADADDAVRANLICKMIGEELIKHYPGRRWYVDVSIQGGTADIMCPAITNEFAYTMHIHNKTPLEIRQHAVKAGGQVLEMFRLSRERWAKGGESSLARDLRGNALKAKTGL